MGVSAGAPYPVRYTVVPLIGPDGVGKTTLLQALGLHLQRRDGLPAPPLRAVQASGFTVTVLETRTPASVFQMVDFPDAAAEDALLGSTPVQGALLVVSALESVMPGTVRSLRHARELGIPRVAVALTKCDAVEDAEMLDFITMETRETVNKHEYEGESVPVGCVAALAALAVLAGDERRRMALAELLEGVQRWTS